LIIRLAAFQKWAYLASAASIGVSQMGRAKICVVPAILAVAPGIVLTVKDAPAATPSLAVGPQYDSTHVYVTPEDLDRFTTSLVSTFGGAKTQSAVFTVTPTPSDGRETTGYEIDDLSDTLTKAKAAGATVLVEPYSVATRRAAMVQFPGGFIAEIHSDNGK
jgi:predicted enzyme related to lactoylglutathione lyase